jgi:endonuclease
MPIYAKPVRLLMKDMADSFALQPGQAFARQHALDWFAQHYPKIRPGTVHCHLIRLSTNAPTSTVSLALIARKSLGYNLFSAAGSR